MKRSLGLFQIRCLVGLAGLMLLNSCVLPATGSQAVSRVSLPLAPVSQYDLEGDPSFTPEQLPPEMRIWYTHLWEGMEEANDDRKAALNPETLASSGDLYKLGRFFNVYITSLLTTLRVTNDLTLLDEVDRLLEIARETLGDPNVDGYRNWPYLTLTDSSTADLIGDDYHEMDDILTHSLVAAAAAALHANAEYDVRYAQHAAFWTDYLKNDFEAKWRERNDVPVGFPFMNRDLTHPYVQFIRYHHYMFELTGDDAYRREALRRANNIPLQFREVFTASGPGYVWDQRFFPDGEGTRLGCQPFVYLQYTFQGLQDLALEGLDVFGTPMMQRVATSMAELVMDNRYTSFAPDICGDIAREGLLPSRGELGTTFQFIAYPFATVGKWDATGSIMQTVMAAFEQADIEKSPPARANLSAIMLFLLAPPPNE